MKRTWVCIILLNFNEGSVQPVPLQHTLGVERVQVADRDGGEQNFVFAYHLRQLEEERLEWVRDLFQNNGRFQL